LGTERDKKVVREKNQAEAAILLQREEEHAWHVMRDAEKKWILQKQILISMLDCVRMKLGHLTKYMQHVTKGL